MKRLVLLILLGMPSFGLAGSLVCSGTVEAVAYHGNNKLMFQLSSMNTPVFFCDPNRTWTVSGADGRSMGGETCKSLFSLFLAARATGQEISRVHFDGDDVPSSCNSFADWKRVFVRAVNF